MSGYKQNQKPKNGMRGQRGNRKQNVSQALHNNDFFFFFKWTILFFFSLILFFVLLLFNLGGWGGGGDHILNREGSNVFACTALAVV